MDERGLFRGVSLGQLLLTQKLGQLVAGIPEARADQLCDSIEYLMADLGMLIEEAAELISRDGDQFRLPEAFRRAGEDVRSD